MSHSIRQLARAIRDRWRDGDQPDLQAALAEHPDLVEDNSALIDLAYENYSLRRAAGQAIDVEEFCGRFPSCRSALRELIEADQVIGHHPQLVEHSAPRPVVGPDDWPLEGTELCGCRLLRELGRGGFARVYLASELNAGCRPVALKVSRHSSNEAHALGPLHHDHVVPIHWARQAPGGWNVVCMPFLGTATLQDVSDRLYLRPDSRPRRGQEVLAVVARMAWPDDPAPAYSLPDPELHRLGFVEAVARLGWRLAEALAFLHQRNLYHLDLKPSNVLLTPQGVPLLLDFNLARKDQAPAPLLGGTFSHMAPEQLEAILTQRPLNDDEAAPADLFALGVVLYELLCGQHPFGTICRKSAAEDVHAMLNLQQAGFTPLRRRRPDVPRRVARLVERCLAFDPADRPASAAEVAEQLRPGPPRRWPRRLAVALVPVAVALALLAIALPARRRGPAELRAEGKEKLRAAARLLDEGGPAQARKTLLAADDCFSKAIERHIQKTGAMRGQWQDYFHRGQVAVLSDDLPLARGYFRESAALLLERNGGRPDRHYGAILACDSYCLSREKDHGRALHAGEKALAAGYRNPALLNNLAYSALQRKELGPARLYLTEALRRDPQLAAAYRNRAALGELIAQRGILQHPLPPKPLAVPEHAWLDIARAIELARKPGRIEPAELYVDAARIHARAAIDRGRSPAERDRHILMCRGYLQRACVLGANPATQDREQLLARALGRLKLQELAALRKQAPVSALSTYLVNPLPADLD